MKRYYIFIMFISFGLMVIFFLLGIKGVLSPFPAITGGIASIVGVVGAGIDMKDKN